MATPSFPAHHPQIVLGLLSLGGNQGEVEETFRQAVGRIDEHLGRVLATSSLYQTPFWTLDEAAPRQPDYLNACLLLVTTRSAADLLEGLLELEREFGRDRPADASGPSPRPLDIDLIDYGGQIIEGGPPLMVPHPRMAQRLFVLVPTAEIYPTYQHPQSEATIQELIAQCPDDSVVMRLAPRAGWPATYTP